MSWIKEIINSEITKNYADIKDLINFYDLVPKELPNMMMIPFSNLIFSKKTGQIKFDKCIFNETNDSQSIQIIILAEDSVNQLNYDIQSENHINIPISKTDLENVNKKSRRRYYFQRITLFSYSDYTNPCNNSKENQDNIKIKELITKKFSYLRCLKYLKKQMLNLSDHTLEPIGINFIFPNHANSLILELMTEYGGICLDQLKGIKMNQNNFFYIAESILSILLNFDSSLFLSHICLKNFIIDFEANLTNKYFLNQTKDVKIIVVSEDNILHKRDINNSLKLDKFIQSSFNLIKEYYIPPEFQIYIHSNDQEFSNQKEENLNLKLNVAFNNNIDLEKSEIYSYGILILDFYDFFDHFSLRNNFTKDLISNINNAKCKLETLNNIIKQRHDILFKEVSEFFMNFLKKSNALGGSNLVIPSFKKLQMEVSSFNDQIIKNTNLIQIPNAKNLSVIKDGEKEIDNNSLCLNDSINAIKEFELLIQIALLCISYDPKDRPNYKVLNIFFSKIKDGILPNYIKLKEEYVAILLSREKFKCSQQYENLQNLEIIHSLPTHNFSSHSIPNEINKKLNFKEFEIERVAHIDSEKDKKIQKFGPNILNNLNISNPSSSIQITRIKKVYNYFGLFNLLHIFIFAFICLKMAKNKLNCCRILKKSCYDIFEICNFSKIYKILRSKFFDSKFYNFLNFILYYYKWCKLSIVDKNYFFIQNKFCSISKKIDKYDSALHCIVLITFLFSNTILLYLIFLNSLPFNSISRIKLFKYISFDNATFFPPINQWILYEFEEKIFSDKKVNENMIMQNFSTYLDLSILKDEDPFIDFISNDFYLHSILNDTSIEIIIFNEKNCK